MPEKDPATWNIGAFWPWWHEKHIVPIGFGHCIQWAYGRQLDAPIHVRCLFMFSPRITRFYAKGH